jgi:hypothetical protein
MPIAKGTAITATTQQFLEIHDITSDFVILKNGSTSTVINVAAMNFNLLSEEEQDAIIYSYAGLLNSLNYNVQIVIRSQTKDVTSYLNTLKGKEDEVVNRQRKQQLKEYREFITGLIEERNVLDKKFYVVITASGLELGLVTAKSVVPGVKDVDISLVDQSVIVDRAKNILDPRRDHIISQFARIGLRARPLVTQELIQLFYGLYNPEAEGQKMDESSSYVTPAVAGNEQNLFERHEKIDQAGTQQTAAPAATGATPPPAAPEASPAAATAPAV